MAASRSNSDTLFSFRVSGYFEPEFAEWRASHNAGKRTDEAKLYHLASKALNAQARHPRHAFDPPSKLKVTPIRRLKLGARGRLFYIADPQAKTTILLYIGATRRDGDKRRDAYAEFEKLLGRGKFDAELEELPNAW